MPITPLTPMKAAAVVGLCAACWKLSGRVEDTVIKEIVIAGVCAACALGGVNESIVHAKNAKQLATQNKAQRVQQQQQPKGQVAPRPGRPLAIIRSVSGDIFLTKR